MQDRRCRHRAEQQAAGKPHPLQDRRHRRGHDEQHREFAERRRRRARRHRIDRRAHERQPRRQPDHDQQHPHHLHDGDAAQVGVELRRQRHDLRHRARAGAEQRGQRLPAVHEPQVAGGGEKHHQRRDHQDRDARRPVGDALEHFGRHHGAEQDADQHEGDARDRQHHHHGPAGQGGGCRRQHRPHDQAGRKAGRGHRDAAQRRNHQRFRGPLQVAPK